MRTILTTFISAVQRLYILIIPALIAAPFVAPARAAAATTNTQLIPLYEYSGLPTFATDWSNACSLARPGSFIIEDRTTRGAIEPSIDGMPNTMLPHDGYASDPLLATAMNDCYDQGSIEGVLGYVNTWDYTAGTYVPWQNPNDPYDPYTVKGQINLWYALYPGAIAGIFFDQVQTAGSTVNKSYYRTAAAYVHNNKAPNNEVVFNFGSDWNTTDWPLSSSNSARNADIVVVFEGCYTGCTSGSNLDTWVGPYTWSPKWELNYPSNYFATLVYDVDASDIPAACSALGSTPAGNGTFFYLTNDTLPNPWDGFVTPSYQASVHANC